MNNGIDDVNNINNVMVDIKDIKKYIVPIHNNKDSPDMTTIKLIKQEEYKDFERILTDYSINGHINISKARLLWLVYNESSDILKVNMSKLRGIDEKIIDEWIKIFKLPIDELYQTYGTINLSIGFNILTEFVIHKNISEKYSRIYSKAKTIDGWLALAEEHSYLYSQKYPIDLTNIVVKMNIINNLRGRI